MHLVLDRLEVRRALDGIRYCREENVGIALLDMLDGRCDVIELFALVAPHQKHPYADAMLLRKFDSASDLLHRNAALHCVQDALAAALRAYPDPIAAKIPQRFHSSLGLQAVGSRNGLKW